MTPTNPPPNTEHRKVQSIRDGLDWTSMPENIDAERFVLGAIMTTESAFPLAAGTLSAEDFSLEKHKRIFLRMSELHERGEKIDRITLANELIKQGQLQSVDGLSYLVSLDDGLPELHNIESYVRIVREKADLRRIIGISRDAIGQCVALNNPREIVGAIEESLIKISSTRQDSTLVGTSKIVSEYEGGINAFLDASKRIKGIATGFLKFDEMTGGLRESELFILAARPAVGKTAFALNIAAHVAMNPKNPQPVAIFSLEMSKESLLTRLICGTARVDQQRFRAGYLNAEERHALQDALYRIVESPIYIDDSAGTNLMDVHSKLRRLQAERGLGLVVVDYLQLMQGRGRYENRVQEITSLSRGFKLMSKELSVPFLVLSQLSRAPETRPGDHRPMLSDLRESGCLTGDTLIVNADSGKRVPICSVQTGMSVWALNETTLKIEKAKVSASFSTGTKRVFTIRTQLGRTIKATSNHPFKTWDGWTELKNIKRGTRIAMPRFVPTAGNSPEREMSYDELALLGHMIGNGCALPTHAVQYTSGDYEMCEVVADLAKRLFGAAVAPRISPERTWFQVYLSSTRRHTHGVHSAIRDWLEPLGLFGKRSPEKFVPDLVFQQSWPDIAAFIRHLWCTDGCLWNEEGHYPGVYYASSSARLASDVQSLLLRIGINATVSPASQMSKGRPQTHVAISGKTDILRFCQTVAAVGTKRLERIAQIKTYFANKTENTNRDVIPAKVWTDYAKPAMEENGITTREMMRRLKTAYCGTGIYKQNVSRFRALKLAVAVQCEAIRLLADSDVYWDRVVDVDYAGEEEVFDLTIPGYHNFIANDFLPHNSIEQDADIVAFIFREEMYRPDKESLKGLAELILAKQRNGPTGRIKLAFLNRYTKFENLASDTGDDFTDNSWYEPQEDGDAE